MISRDDIEVLAIAWMFGFSLLIYLVWVLAYLNDGTVTVVIDMFGEMPLEFALWLIVIPVLAVGLHNYLEDPDD